MPTPSPTPAAPPSFLSIQWRSLGCLEPAEI